MPESATLAFSGGYYYLFYNLSKGAERYRIGASPTGPWLGPYRLGPGWAHEVWQTIDGDWFTSYLTYFTVTIAPLSWDQFYSPPRPFIGAAVHHVMLPLVIR
jgi:hypothetical protein